MADCFIIQNRNVKGLSIVSWQNDTDAEIAAIVSAADAENIDLSDTKI